MLLPKNQKAFVLAQICSFLTKTAYKHSFLFKSISAALLNKPETDELFVLAKDTMSAVNVFSCKEGKYSKQVNKDVNQHLTAICCRRQASPGDLVQHTRPRGDSGTHRWLLTKP